MAGRCYRPTGGTPSANRRCPEPDANRASTGIATIVRGSSGPVHPDTAFQPADGIPRMNRRTPKQVVPTGLLPVWRTTYENATNRASTGVVTELFSQICAREGAETKSNGYRYHATREKDFNQDLSGRCQLGFYQCGSDFGAKWETNSHRFPLRLRIGRDQHTTPGRRRQLKIWLSRRSGQVGVANTGGFSQLTEVNPCQLEGAFQS